MSKDDLSGGVLLKSKLHEQPNQTADLSFSRMVLWEWAKSKNFPSMTMTLADGTNTTIAAGWGSWTGLLLASPLHILFGLIAAINGIEQQVTARIMAEAEQALNR